MLEFVDAHLRNWSAVPRTIASVVIGAGLVVLSVAWSCRSLEWLTAGLGGSSAASWPFACLLTLVSLDITLAFSAFVEIARTALSLARL